jgi:hypothetical protein
MRRELERWADLPESGESVFYLPLRASSDSSDILMIQSIKIIMIYSIDWRRESMYAYF